MEIINHPAIYNIRVAPQRPPISHNKHSNLLTRLSCLQRPVLRHLLPFHPLHHLLIHPSKNLPPQLPQIPPLTARRLLSPVPLLRPADRVLPPDLLQPHRLPSPLPPPPPQHRRTTQTTTRKGRRGTSRGGTVLLNLGIYSTTSTWSSGN